MPTQSAPPWLSSNMVFIIGTSIDHILTGTHTQYQTLLRTRFARQTVANETLNRVIAVYSRQDDDLGFYDEQLRRWAAEPLTPLRRREVERLQDQMVVLHTVVTNILALAGELKTGTIETVLTKDDAELGLETLLRMFGEQDSRP